MAMNETAVEAHLRRFKTQYIPITVSEHLDVLRAAGFRVAGPFWLAQMQAGFYAIKQHQRGSKRTRVRVGPLDCRPAGALLTPLNLTILDDRLAVCRLDPQAAIPAWATSEPFCSITRTAGELSIVCAESHVPAGVVCERGWRALKAEGPFDFAVVGVLAALAQPLAEASIPILAIGTYDTDYVLVKEAQLERAVAALAACGHHIQR
jgi:hypothetical protein